MQSLLVMFLSCEQYWRVVKLLHLYYLASTFTTPLSYDFNVSVIKQQQALSTRWYFSKNNTPNRFSWNQTIRCNKTWCSELPWNVLKRYSADMYDCSIISSPYPQQGYQVLNHSSFIHRAIKLSMSSIHIVKHFCLVNNHNYKS